MKKFLAVMICAVMCFVLTACAGNPSTDNSSDAEASTAPSSSVVEPSSTPEEPSSEVSSEEPSSSEAEEAPAAGDATTMETFIESIQDQVDGMSESLKESGMNLEVLARGNSLVYLYQFTEDLGDTSLIKDGLEQSLEGVSSTFENVLSLLKTAVSDAESVIVEYLDKDGNVILSKEYK